MNLKLHSYNNSEINKFLHKNSLLSLCVSSQHDFWAANCFFKFNEENMSLWISTSESSRHSKIMLANNTVVGTMLSNSLFFPIKKGMQYKGRISRLEGEELKIARSLFLRKFPLLRNKVNHLWEIKLDEIKLMGFRIGGSQIVTWRRFDC